MNTDNAKDLHMLFKIYVLFAIIIGVPLAFGGLLFSLKMYAEWSFDNCCKFQHSCLNCTKPEPLNARVIWGTTVLTTLVLLVFRIEIACLMRRDWKEFVKDNQRHPFNDVHKKPVAKPFVKPVV